nr:twin-arginine translocase subunit TatC [Thermaerobacter sp.]
KRQRKYALMLAFVAAAALAPPDAVSMLIMAMPIYLLYEVSLLIATLTWRTQLRRASREAQAVV